MSAQRLSIHRGIAFTAILILFSAVPAPIHAAAISADVSVAKARTSPSPVSPGSVIVYSVTVTNSGPDAATNIVLTDVIPANTTFFSFSTGASGIVCTTPPVGGTGTITCPFAPLHATVASGISFPFQLELRVDPGASGTIANTATVSSDTPDPDSSNNTSTALTDVAPSVPVSKPVLFTLALLLATGGRLLVKR